MARRKKMSRKQARYFTKKVYSRKSSSSSLLSTLVGAGIYGALREKVSTYIQPYTSKLPLGNISDEVGMIALSFIGKKFLGSRIPMSQGVFKAGMIIEGARIGEAVATGTTGLSGLGSFNGGTPQPTQIQSAGMNVYS